MTKRKIIMVLLLHVVFATAFAQNNFKHQAYRWKSVAIAGGGFVDGVIYHPTAKNVLYCRTDIGGAYRWNETQKSWEPLLDWVTGADDNLMGVESIALDPSNPNLLYMACGTYTNAKGPNAILRSDDRGKTFKRTDVPFHMGGNENGRGNGERMAVDPANGNNIYIGTRHDGLWRSIDRGVTWNKVQSFPEISEPPAEANTQNRPYRQQSNGIIFVLFGKVAKNASSGIIYAGISQKGKDNLFYSTDAGATWLPVAGQPNNFMPTHAVLATDGMLYVTYGTNPGPDRMTDGAVWKLNITTGEWKEITPIKPEPANQKEFGYAAVSVDAQHPQSVIVSSFSRYGKAGGEDIFRTIDGGITWKPIFTGSKRAKFDYANAPYVAHTGIHWLFDLEIDPFNSNHAIFTTGYGLHETFDLTDADKGDPTTWDVMNQGIEETVALDMASPPKGAQLISAVGDYGGFVHYDLDKPLPEGNFMNPHFANTTGISCAELNSDIMVRVGVASTQVGGGNIGYSLNGGKDWNRVLTTPQPDSKSGSICVSADGSVWIWTPGRSATAYLTRDHGTTWAPINDLPVGIRITADKVNAHKFYAIDLSAGKLYSSDDNGSSFQSAVLQLPGGLLQTNTARGDARGGQNRLYATPGQESDLWIAAFDGIYHGNAAGVFNKVADVQEAHGLGFGKAAPGNTRPTLYLAGVISGTNGVFRSDDFGKNWLLINDASHQWGLILQVIGDPKKYGRVYVGTHGRGIFYGDPN
jgi:photosystem II stability/assembly factor-like uncharacterized protein